MAVLKIVNWTEQWDNISYCFPAYKRSLIQQSNRRPVFSIVYCVRASIVLPSVVEMFISLFYMRSVRPTLNFTLNEPPSFHWYTYTGRFMIVHYGSSKYSLKRPQSSNSQLLVTDVRNNSKTIISIQCCISETCQH